MKRNGTRLFRAVLSLFMAASMLLSTVALASNESGAVKYADGVWQGSGGGHNDDVTVQVTIQDGSITDVSAVEHHEDASYWAKAEALFDEIVKQQTWEVDTVAGATDSSNGIRQAAMSALNKAAKAATENEPYSGGTGTQEDPYLISNAKQLATLADTVDEGTSFEGLYVALTDDIDLSQVESWNPIGGEEKNAANLFQGTFDGRGHTISGMKIAGDYTAETNLGLFSTLGVGAVVKGVNLTDVSITATGSNVIRAGAIAGDTKSGTELGLMIDSCSATGAINVTVNEKVLAFAGGIVGRMMSYASVTNCWTDVEVNEQGTESIVYAGGIVGMAGGNTVLMNCASLGAIYANSPLGTTSGGQAGGIGSMISGKMWSNYAMGNVTIGSAGASNCWIGALAGQITTTGMTKNGNEYVYPDTGALRAFGYYPSDLVLTNETWSDASTRTSMETVELTACGSGKATSDTIFQGTPLARADMTDEAFAETLNGNLKSVSNLLSSYGIDALSLNKWTVQDGKVLPIGAVWVDPTPDDTLFGGGTGTAEDPYLILTADQMKAFAGSLNDGVDYHNYFIKLDADIDLSGENWKPVGGSDYAFDGTFDGAGHTIRGLTEGSESEALQLDKDNIYIGLFGVLGQNAVVENLNLTDVFVNVTFAASVKVGGIAALMDGATVDNCSVRGTLKATVNKGNTFVAGLVADQYKGAIINSMSDTDLSCTVQSGDGIAEAGGLVALNNRGLVANCYTLGDVYGSASRENGDEGMASISALIGVNAGSLVNCYGAGSHTTGEFSKYVGAATGWVTGIGKTYNCWYNADAVMKLGDQIVSPVESIGTKVPGGESDEGMIYTGGVVDKLTPYTAADYPAIAEGLNASFPKFPIDITQFGLATDALRTWTVTDGVVTQSDEMASVTYERPEAENIPETVQEMRDGTWYGRDDGKTTVVAITTENNEVTKTETLQGASSGEGYDAAVAKAKEKAIYGDTTNYEALDPTRFAGGSGTQKDPYQIANEGQLRYLAEGLNADVKFEGLYFKQTADITLTGGEWLPIGWGIMAEINNKSTQYCAYPFLGSYDGGGYTIFGLTIGSRDKASEDPRMNFAAGLFGFISGENNTNAAPTAKMRISNLKNINLKDVSIHISSRYQNFVAGLVGNAQNGFLVDNCHISGTVTAYSQDSFARAAGVAGNAIRGVVINTSAAVDVSADTDAGNAYVGGFYAIDNRVTTVNCYASGSVTGNSGNNNKVCAGGFGGQAGGARYNCYASGDVVSNKTTTDVGGFNGRLAGIAVDNRCYFNTDAKQEIAGTAVEPKVASGAVVPKNAAANQTEGKTAAELSSDAFVATLNENRAAVAGAMTELQEIIKNSTDLEHTVLYTGDGSDLKEWKLLDGIAGLDSTPLLAKQTITVGQERYKKIYGDKAFSLGAKAEGTLSYKSSNPKVVTVKNGKVTIVGAGKATITITAAATDTAAKATKTVSVTVAKGSQKISVSKKKITKVVGAKAFKLSAKTTGDGKPAYASNNKKVAAVNKTTGKVTIKGAGVAKITISAKATANVNKAKNVVVTVTVNPKAVTKLNVKAGKKRTAAVTWKVNNKKDTYQIQYSTKKNFKGAKTVKAKKGAKTATLKSLKKGTYYVRIRAVQNKHSSAWSKAKAVKIK